MPKRVLFFVHVSLQRGLSATYLAPILSIFETTDVNRFLHAYTGEKFLRRGFSTSQEQLILVPGDFGTVDSRVFVIEFQAKRYNFWRRESSFRGLVYIPWMCLLYVSIAGGVRFGRCHEKAELSVTVEYVRLLRR